MIITKLQGGLANQLFQWAYGRSLSEKYNTPLYLDIEFYQNQFSETKRSFSLSKFPNISYNITPDDKNISNWSLEKDKIRFIRLSDDFNFKELIYQQDCHYYLDGYWHTEKYFTEIEGIIRKELKPSDEIINKLVNFQPIENNNVSIHIRRTDYVESNGYHPVQPISYYEKALEIIGHYDNVVVFSDDIKWCKENLNFDNMIFVDGFDDIEDIWLMSMCKNNIIANSSFSWWGSWLNNNKDKKVIAPLKWFGVQTNINTSDIIPNSWIKI